MILLCFRKSKKGKYNCVFLNKTLNVLSRLLRQYRTATKEHNNTPYRQDKYSQPNNLPSKTRTQLLEPISSDTLPVCCFYQKQVLHQSLLMQQMIQNTTIHRLSTLDSCLSSLPLFCFVLDLLLEKQQSIRSITKYLHIWRDIVQTNSSSM